MNWLAVLSTVLLMGSAVLVYADEDMAPTGDGTAMEQGDGPHEMGDGRFGKRMKEKLGLTEDQATKLKDLMKSQMEKNKPLMDQVKIDMDVLQQKVDTKASDTDVKSALDKLSADRKTMESARETSMEKAKAILNPTQQAKFILSMRGMRKGWGQGGGWKKHDGGSKGPGAKGKAAKPAPNDGGDSASN